ncbi:hypothetical protein D9M68_942840 [compost metagenome]
MACSGMTVGFALFWIGAHPGFFLWLGVLVVMLACAWFVVSRPEPSPAEERS